MGLFFFQRRVGRNAPEVTDPGDEVAFDRDLVARLLEGDPEAFGHFFDHHARAVFRYAESHLRGDPDEVDDVTQAVLTQALEGLSRYRGEGPLAAWLVGICRFEISARRRRRRRGEHVGLDEEDPAVLARAEGRPATPARPDREHERRERRRLVHWTLGTLPEHYRRVLAGKYLEGSSVADLAEQSGMTLKAMESLLTRARVAFQRQYRACGGDLGPAAGSAKGERR